MVGIGLAAVHTTRAVIDILTAIDQIVHAGLDAAEIWSDNPQERLNREVR